MAKYTGSALVVTYGSSSWPSNIVKSADEKQTIKAEISTGAGDGDETYLTTVKDTEVTLDLWDDATTATVWTKVAPGTTATTLTINPQGTTTGTPKRTGQAFVIDRERGVPFNNVVPIKVTLKVTGGLTDATN